MAKRIKWVQCRQSYCATYGVDCPHSGPHIRGESCAHGQGPSGPMCPGCRPVRGARRMWQVWRPADGALGGDPQVTAAYARLYAVLDMGNLNTWRQRYRRGWRVRPVWVIPEGEA